MMGDEHWQGICGMANNRRLPKPDQEEMIRKQAGAVVATGERPIPEARQEHLDQAGRA